MSVLCVRRAARRCVPFATVFLLQRLGLVERSLKGLSYPKTGMRICVVGGSSSRHLLYPVPTPRCRCSRPAPGTHVGLGGGTRSRNVPVASPSIHMFMRKLPPSTITHAWASGARGADYEHHYDDRAYEYDYYYDYNDYQ